MFKHQVGVVHNLHMLFVTSLHIFQSSHLGAPYSWVPLVAGLVHGSATMARFGQQLQVHDSQPEIRGLVHDSATMWNYSLSPGWTPEEAEILTIALMKFGVGFSTYIQ